VAANVEIKLPQSTLASKTDFKPVEVILLVATLSLPAKILHRVVSNCGEVRVSEPCCSREASRGGDDLLSASARVVDYDVLEPFTLRSALALLYKKKMWCSTGNDP